jgi:methylglyoxal synthase
MLTMFWETSPSLSSYNFDIKNIALIAHDNLKDQMVEWTKTHMTRLHKCNLFATGTT